MHLATEQEMNNPDQLLKTLVKLGAYRWGLAKIKFSNPKINIDQNFLNSSILQTQQQHVVSIKDEKQEDSELFTCDRKAAGKINF